MFFSPPKVCQGAMGARVFSPKLLSHLHRASRRGARRWRMFAIWHLQKEFAGRDQESRGREVARSRERQQRVDNMKADMLDSK